MGIMKYYLRINANEFGFVIEGINTVLDTDIQISEEEYNTFFNMQSQGKQFRVKQQATGNSLFDYIEEYIPEFNIEPPSEIDLLKEEVLQQSESMLDMDFRLTSLELGL